MLRTLHALVTRSGMLSAATRPRPPESSLYPVVAGSAEAAASGPHARPSASSLESVRVASARSSCKEGYSELHAALQLLVLYTAAIVHDYDHRWVL